MINRKAKGTRGERELVKFFNENEWACIRIAGSGSSRYPSPDLLAGNASRRLAIECKVSAERRKYFAPDEVEQLRCFSERFGAESWIAVKFPDEPWYFLMLEDLERTGSNYGVSVALAKLRGLTKEEIIGSPEREKEE